MKTITLIPLHHTPLHHNTTHHAPFHHITIIPHTTTPYTRPRTLYSLHHTIHFIQHSALTFAFAFYVLPFLFESYAISIFSKFYIMQRIEGIANLNTSFVKQIIILKSATFFLYTSSFPNVPHTFTLYTKIKSSFK